jgi:type IV secretion system protein VirB5
MRTSYRKALLSVIAATFVISGAGPATASGIPVIDVANLEQAVQQLIHWQKQIKAMRDQFEQAEKQYSSLTGVRGFGQVLMNPALQSYLPPDLAKTYSAVMRGDLSTAAKGLRKEAQIYNCEDRTGASRTQCQAYLNKPFEEKAAALQAYDTATAKLQQINGLMDQIQRTTDPKGIAELQARLSGEALVLQNETNRLQIYAQLAQVQMQLMQQQNREQNIKQMSNTRRAVDTLAPVTFR